MTTAEACASFADASALESSFTMMAAVRRLEERAIDLDELAMEVSAWAFVRLRRLAAVSDRVAVMRP